MSYRTFTLLVSTTALLAIPQALFAQEFIPLVGVPGVSDNAQDFESYANALYMLAIGIAVLIAVVKIIAAGVQYMFSEIVTSKENAKKDIGGALFGLLIILGAVIILETINPNLSRFDFLDTADPVLVSPSHDDIREQEREMYPNVVRTFSGADGSPEHMAFIRECLNTHHGRAVQQEGNTRIVECRTQ